MSKVFMNKVGDEKVLSIWWFFVLALVAAGVAAGVFMFYSAPFDVRELESGILVDKVFDCMNDNGYLRSDALLEGFDIYFSCNIERRVFFEDGALYYLSIEISDSEDLLYSNYSRVDDLRKNCLVEKSIKTKDFPKCDIRSEDFLFFDEGVQKELTVSVMAVSNQRGRALPLL
ncbi:hypothetical protein KAR91_16430 [Candidatus Pacearchaeota archaeon]|nr:hypothetical protein [Candidatus Pacearchaeota archaeon]